jgi:chromate transport protein ChrA
MKPVDRFSELILLTIISLGIVIVVILAGLFGYILVRNIIEKKKKEKESKK